MGALFTPIMHTQTGRIAVVAWWAWLGLHLFSKTDPPRGTLT
jgi:hypothetical protein